MRLPEIISCVRNYLWCVPTFPVKIKLNEWKYTVRRFTSKPL